MRYTGPKTKRARRLGESLRDQDAKHLVKRNYPPGMHGQSRTRLSEFAVHHREKQKAKWIYEIQEKQFRRYVDQAARKKGMTGNVLLQSLEYRLDNVVYRLGFAASRSQARQLVNHGFFTVNGKKVDIPSYQTKVGDMIAVAPGKADSKYMERQKAILKDFKTQEWLSLDASALSGKILGAPTADNTGSTLQMELIVEHYNK
jgi:small subunit ribosomal protein S4